MSAFVKPRRLRAGDRIAVVSLSNGMMGDAQYRHTFDLGCRRLRERFGLDPVAMPHALRGSAWLHDHPEARASDLMQAFSDPDIAGVITAIGGDDGVRLAPYVDLDVIRENPKVFMGYSDTTVHHFLMAKTGLVSFYGPQVMSGFAEYGSMFPYTEDAVRRVLFEPTERLAIEKCPYWAPEEIVWDESRVDIPRARVVDRHGYVAVQGEGAGPVRGRLIGGCLDAFPMYVGTPAWPPLELWDGAILFLETSSDCPIPSFVAGYLRNLGAQGILGRARGIIFGKPRHEKYFDEYQAALRWVLAEFGRSDMPVLFNANFGHTAPIGVIPYGIECELDVDARTITLLEAAVL